jgi:type II secretory pathway component PulK
MMKRMLKNSRGVALMLVLSAISVLTAMGIEFAYNTSIYYNLAHNELDRLQAYYMAMSAYNFMQLELKFDRVFKQTIQSQNLGQYLGSNAQLPLCQQFPLSTGLIRAVFTGGGVEALMGGDTGEEAPEGEVPEEIQDMQKDVSMSQEQGAADFLQFEGDFDGECIDEGTKIDLNGFAGLAQTAAEAGGLNPYDQYKQFLFRFMSQPRFRLLFESADVRVTDVVNNIGDWIDDNRELNDFDGRTGGAEVSIYQRIEAPYEVRNGKLVTLLEAYLIEGVVDEWFQPMMDFFTIYGDGKVNVCTTSDEVLEGLVRRYVDDTPDLPPLRLEDPEEMQRLTDAIAEACAQGGTGDQLKQNINTALAAAIGSIAGAQEPGATPAGGATGGFADYVSTDSRYFSLKLAGQVGDITVRIKAVLDVKETDPTKWRLLYWRVY